MATKDGDLTLRHFNLTPRCRRGRRRFSTGWISSPTVPVPPPVRTLILVFIVVTPAQPGTTAKVTDVNKLVREVIENEIKGQTNEAADSRLWSYRKMTLQRGEKLLLEYCETKRGII